MAHPNEDNKQNKFILLTSMEGNDKILISGNAQHSVAPMYTDPRMVGTRSSRGYTKLFLDEDGIGIPIGEFITCNNLDLGVGKNLTVHYALTGPRMFYSMLGMEFVEANGLIVDFEKKTVTNPGPNGRTVTGKGLTPDIIEKLYPKNGVVIVQPIISEDPAKAQILYKFGPSEDEEEDDDMAETCV